MAKGSSVKSVTEPPQPARPVPVHALGISQILSYGLMFYAMAVLKEPLAVASGHSETAILTILSLALVLQSLVMPVIGGWADRFGAVKVMRLGFIVGAAGIASLGLITLGDATHYLWLAICFFLIGIGLSMSTYEMAFSAAVQMDERQSRRNISIITFYGGVASSLTWVAIHPLLATFGLLATCLVLSVILLGCSCLMTVLAGKDDTPRLPDHTELAPFRWSLLKSSEKKALLVLGVSGGLEYLMFAATSLLWIGWFQLKFESLSIAVLLASSYGPFQTVGRILEMKLGRYFDARVTGLVASGVVPLALILAQSDQLALAALAMALFGMGHGVLTVSFGFITNLYFRQEIYGRAKGWASAPRIAGFALGPGFGGALFALGGDLFMAVMIGISLTFTALFACLLFLTPTNSIHHTS